MCLGIAEIYKQPITKILSNVPVKTIDDLTTDPLVCWDDFSEVFGVEIGGEVGRFDEVNEHHRELSAFSVRRRCSRERFNLSGWLCLHNRLWCWLSRLRDNCLSACRVASPNETSSCVIDDWVNIEDFFLQVLDIVVIDIKASLDATIRYPSLAFEEVDDLGKNVIEGHKVTLRSGWLPLFGTA